MSNSILIDQIADNAINFIEDLELADINKYTAPPVCPPDSYLVGGALAAFSTKIDDNLKQDILDATLFAQLCANEKFNPAKQMQDWYNFYTVVLENLGFTIKNVEFEQHQAKMDTFTMESIVAEINDGSTNNAEETRATLGAMMNTMRKKPNGDECVKLFTELCCCSDTTGNFQVMPCHIGPDGEIYFLLGTYFYQAEKHEKDILFSTWNSKTTRVYKSVQKVTYDHDAYGAVRQAVSLKLKDAASRLVAFLSY